jgi:hypothetical protein
MYFIHQVIHNVIREILHLDVEHSQAPEHTVHWNRTCRKPRHARCRTSFALVFNGYDQARKVAHNKFKAKVGYQHSIPEHGDKKWVK